VLGFALGHLGQFSEALACAEEGLRIAEAANHAYSITSSLYTFGVILLLRQDDTAALRILERGVEIWQKLQSPPWGALTAALGVAHCRTGRLSYGLALLEAAPDQSPGDFIYPRVMALAEGYLFARRAEDARLQAQRALELSRQRGEHGSEAYALRVLAQAAAYAGPPDIDASAQHYQAALALAEPRGMRPLVAHCHLGLAKLYRRTGKREQAREHLTTATTMYREMEMRFWLEQADAEMKELG
jgi:tetratricopeptide (TPR) repeat protein